MQNLAIDQLRKFVAESNWRYRVSGPNATEPAALACLALCAEGMHEQAQPIADWLASLQTSAGSVGVTESEQKPAWPTSLALLSWMAVGRASDSGYQAKASLALQWILSTQGKRLPRRRQIGHDTTIDGWSWAENTHSWLEPTSLFVLALKASGHSDHPRTRSGVAMIIDRLHETGGCNYGNTIVLGQATLPHVQPTGLAMLALAGEESSDPRIERSLDYLEASLQADTATASLCFALLGLTAHVRRPNKAEQLVHEAIKRDQNSRTQSCYKSALLSLASLADQSWLPHKSSKIQTASNVS